MAYVCYAEGWMIDIISRHLIEVVGDESLWDKHGVFLCLHAKPHDGHCYLDRVEVYSESNHDAMGEEGCIPSIRSREVITYSPMPEVVLFISG